MTTVTPTVSHPSHIESDSVAASFPTREREPSQKLRRLWRWSGLLIVISLTAFAVAFGVTWLQERGIPRAEKALVDGNPEEAFELITEFLTENPNNSRALALLGRTYVALGKPDRAIAIFNQSGVASVEDMHALAQTFMLLGRWSDAVRFLDRVVKLQPDNVDALYEITSCRLRLGLFDAALKSANRFSQQPGSESRGYVFLGTIHADRKNYQQAVKAYARVLDFDPQATALQVRADEFFLQYGRVLALAGRQADAVGHLRHSAALLPTADVYVELGNCCQQLQQMEDATENWRQALEYDPVEPRARVALANAALRANDAVTALKWLTPLKRSPQLNSSSAYLLQRTYALAGDRQQVEHWQAKAASFREQEQIDRTIESILVDDPNSYWAFAVRAHRFAEAGDWEEAQGIMNSLMPDAADEPFLIELAEAVRNRSALPSLNRVPLIQF